MQHSRFMRAALKEALKGVGATSPNPTVGAVIVKHGRILSRGWHRQAGQPHAEVEALRALAAPGHARGATLYVTLEPCSTHGRTPPCTDAIISAGFKRVVVGATDPHPSHAGRGLELLKQNGIEVLCGVLEPECRRINRAFFKWITTGRPWVIAKAGMSLDGRITRVPGEGQWLTGPAARRDAHRLRALSDAVLVGAGTVRADDPSLTVRSVPLPAGKQQPWRVVVTRSGDLPQGARLLSDEFQARTRVFQNRPLADVLAELGRDYKTTTVLAEGGGTLLANLFAEGLVDEVCFYIAPLLCGGPSLAVAETGLQLDAIPLADVEVQKLGRDLRLSAVVKRP
jgi:diaminohydroxyphosphoribosylaminopyrimidine deaminase/5-amino-6-(5-phosphoribosylamino)uracil reductase